MDALSECRIKNRVLQHGAEVANSVSLSLSSASIATLKALLRQAQTISDASSHSGFTRSSTESRPIFLAFSFHLCCAIGGGSTAENVKIILGVALLVTRKIVHGTFFFIVPFSPTNETIFSVRRWLCLSILPFWIDQPLIARTIAEIGKEIFERIAVISSR
jgi:hypothetical protein